MSNYQPTFTRQNCQDFATKILKTKSWRKRLKIVDDTLASLPENDSSKSWQGYLRKFRNWCEAVANDSAALAYVPFSIFIRTGNVKLPFVSFSTLPGFTCPGAGACLDYCYSYRAWRYPAGFLRQLQNTILMQTRQGRNIIAHTFQALETSWNGERYCVTIRLYVDGDFASVGDFTFWMQLLETRQDDCEAYGYSKSWREILQGVQFLNASPSNYVLNVSGGSLHGDDLREQILALPFTRQVFEAVEIDGEGLVKGFAKYDSAEYHKRTREAYQSQTGTKGFSCPGKCGDCRASSGKHACGDLQFDIPIVIGIH